MYSSQFRSLGTRLMPPHNRAVIVVAVLQAERMPDLVQDVLVGVGSDAHTGEIGGKLGVAGHPGPAPTGKEADRRDAQIALVVGKAEIGPLWRR